MRKSEKKGPNSKSPRCPIFNFFVVTREVIFQKMAQILDPVNFFWVFSLLSHCGPNSLMCSIFEPRKKAYPSGKRFSCPKNVFLLLPLDRLKLLQKPLPLDPPQNNLWAKINKVVDPLHIVNHKRESCKVLYDPDRVKQALPDSNLMTCEETFSWMSRYQKILNSLPKNQFNFVLHRLFVYRNQYTINMYKERRMPILPSSKLSKKEKEIVTT